MSFITGVGLTSYGKHEGSSSLDLMSKAAELAIADAGLKRAEIDGILCGYSTVSPHIMLATVFAEHFGIQPVLRPRRAGRRRHRSRHDHAGASSGRGRRRQSMCWWSAARTA